MRVFLRLQSHLVFDEGKTFGLDMGVSFGQGPFRFDIGPAKDQAPFSLAQVVEKVAGMLGVTDLEAISSLGKDPPWSLIFGILVKPFLSVSVGKGEGGGSAGAVEFVLQLYGDENTRGIEIGGPEEGGIIQIEPRFTVYDLIVGYDRARGGLDVRARIFLPPQPSDLLANPPAEGEKKPGKMQIVSYPFPVPSQGSKTFEVRYLGLGQRFGPTADLSAPDPMQKLFTELIDNLTSNDPATVLQRVAGYYHPDRNWFIAADIYVRGWEVMFIFNDPSLYGLRVTADKGKFKGLLLEILYQKLGPGLGVFYGALTLPEAFRQVNVGVVALTIPSFRIWIYTNGDFKVAVGWPLGENSIGIEVYVFTGGGGFYFAKLRSADNPQKPGTKVTQYNPILEFGLGVWFGVGRSIKQGVFSASLSLTLQGTFQGILAWRAPDSGAAARLSDPPDYFWFAATLGVVGQLQGEVDLEIIKISVLVRLSLTAGVALETGYGTEIVVSAQVDVEASVRILFIKISVGFHAEISHTFTLTTSDKGNASLEGPRDEAFSAMHDWANPKKVAALAAPAFVRLAAAPVPPRCTPDAEGKWQVPLHFLLQPGAVYTASGGTTQGVATLLIEAPAPGAADAPCTPMETLLTALAGWLVASYGGTGEGTWARVSHALGQGSQLPPDGFDDALRKFLGANVRFTLHPVDLTAKSPDLGAAAFPMFDDLQMSRAVGTDPEKPEWSTPVPFSSVSRTYADYTQVLARYFAQLSLNATTANPAPRMLRRTAAPLLAADGGDGPTGDALSKIVFTDYFLLATRQLAREMADAEAKGKPVGVTAATAASVGGMGSRFLLHGLRLPDPATTPGDIADVHLETLALLAGFALTGQQFPVPVAGDGAGLVAQARLQLTPPPPDMPPEPLAAAILFAGGDEVVSAMPARPAPAAPHPEWIHGLGASAGSITVSPLPAVAAHPLWFALRTRLPWQGAPGNDPTYVVPLPPGVTQQLRRGPLTLTVQTQSPESDPPPRPLPATAALLVHTRIHRVSRDRASNVAVTGGGQGRAVSPYLSHVYRMDGTDDETRDLLEGALKSGALAGAKVQILYNAPTTGYASDVLDLAAHPVLLAKTNLSTTTRPSEANVLLRLDALRESPGLGPVAARADDAQGLLRLVWEASVVHAPGFYLHYATAEGKPLPDGIFAGDVADLTLLVTFPQAGALFQPYHNAFAVAGDLDGALFVGVADEKGTALTTWQPSYPAGCVAFSATWLDRTALLAADAATDPAPYSDDWIASLYHLLQFRVDGPAHPTEGPAFGQSLWSLALSPSRETGGPGSGGPPTPHEQDYRQAVPVYRFVTGAGKSPSPYAAVGGTAELDFQIVDLFGNVLEGDTFSTALPVRYNDPLVSPAEWPGVDVSYRFRMAEVAAAEPGTVAPAAPGGAKQPTLTLHLTFDPCQVVRGGVTVNSDADDTPVQVALARYTTIAAQLADPHVAFQLDTTVLPGDAGTVATTAALRPALAAFADLAIAELKTAAVGGTPNRHAADLAFVVKPAGVATRGDDLFAVGVRLTLSRDPALVDEQARTGLPRAVSTTLDVAAALHELEPAGSAPATCGGKNEGDTKSGTVDVSAWARDFEEVFAAFDGADGRLRVLARTGTSALAADASHPSLWALRWSRTAGVWAEFPRDEAAYFTFAPLSTELMNGPAQVTVYDPATLQPTGQNTVTFSSVDLDAWGQGFLAAMDDLLSPEMAAAIARLDELSPGTPGIYPQLMQRKAHMAQALSRGVVPVYADVSGGGLQAQSGQKIIPGDEKAAQEQFEQALLDSLSRAYAISAVVQVPASVQVAGEAEAGAKSPPRFFGPVSAHGDAPAEYTITTSKLPLQATDTEARYLTFLVSAAQPQKAATLPLDAVYEVRFVEHLFQTEDQDFGYVPSQWLKFVLTDGAEAMDLALQPLEVPVPLRGFPASPVLVRQTPSGASEPSTQDADPIRDALEWDYTVELTEPGNGAQDDLWAEVTYNLPIDPASARLFRNSFGDVRGLFQALAGFHSAWPTLAPLLPRVPAGAFPGEDASLGEGPTAQQVVAAVVAQVAAVTDAWGALMGITDHHGALLFATDPQDVPPAPETDDFVISFDRASTESQLDVFARPRPGAPSAFDPSKAAEWPSINDQRPSAAPVPLAAGKGPDAKGGWYQCAYPFAGGEALTLRWRALDLLSRQTARSTFKVVRNASLSADASLRTNDVLVYRTAPVSFANPVLPLIEVERVGPLPSGASLQDALAQVLRPISQAGSAAVKERYLKVGISYDYALTFDPRGGGTPLMASDHVLQADGLQLTGSDSLAELVAALAQDVNTWREFAQRPTSGALLSLQVVLYAVVAGTRLPVVQLKRVEITVPPDWW